MRGLLAAMLLASGCDMVFRVDPLGPPVDAPADTVADVSPDARTILTCDESPIILRPTGVFTQEWSEQYPDTGSHLDKVIDADAPDDDATYIATAANGQLDLFTHLPLDSGVTIDSVTFWARARLARAGAEPVQFATALRVNMGVYWSDRSLSASWSDYSEVRVVNPMTSQPWTVEVVNAMSFGVRKSYTERVLVTRVWASVECH